MGEPDLLLPYQRRWLEDKAEVKVFVKSRRIGGTYGEELDDTLEAAKSKEAHGQDVFYLSYNKDMTREYVSKVGEWARALNFVCSDVEEVVLKDEDEDVTVFRVKFASGFSVWGMPSVPWSIRGRQGIVVIDEAAFVKDLGEVIKAAVALLMWGGKLRIISTHNGADNTFNLLVQQIINKELPYSLHTVTLDDAISDGLYKRICLMLNREWSPEAEASWRQGLIDFYKDDADEELFCIPKRSGGAYFPRALLEAVSDKSVPVIRKTCKDEFVFASKVEREAEFQVWFDSEIRHVLESIEDPAFGGWDFARSGDLTVLEWDARQADGRLVAKLLIELRNVPFDQQEQTMKMCVSALPHFGAIGIDARGNGQMIAEHAKQEWPTQAHLVMISAGWYAANFPKLKGRMEDQATTIPGDRDVLDDFRVVGMKAGVPQILEHSGKGSNKRHGDAAIAKLMALFASLEDPGTVQAVATARAGHPRSAFHALINRFSRRRNA